METLKTALEALNEIRAEYEEWKDNLPDAIAEAGGAMVEKLEAVADLDIDSAVGSVEEVESMEV